MGKTADSETKSACPNCGQEFSAEVIAKAARQSRVIFEVTPAPGELFDVATVGSVLTNFSKLMHVSSRELGAKAITLLERVECKENGALAFHCLVVRGPNVNRKKP